MKQEYTKEYLIAELHRFHKEFNKIPANPDFKPKKEGYAGVKIYIKHFGSLSNAVKEAGFKTYDERCLDTRKINYCKNCGKEIHTTHTADKQFCNNSCSAIYNNKGRIRTEESKNKTRSSLTIERFPYSKVYFFKCMCCGELFTTRQSCHRKCDNCKKQFGNNQTSINLKKSPYFFRFNVFDYPDIFNNLDLIKKKGWYIPKKNPNGLAKDHRISINAALVNNYDPYYISHPLNCEIMTQKDNIIKSNKSSISYDDLVSLVNEYDLNKNKKG